MGPSTHLSTDKITSQLQAGRSLEEQYKDAIQAMAKKSTNTSPNGNDVIFDPTFDPIHDNSMERQEEGKGCGEMVDGSQDVIHFKSMKCNLPLPMIAQIHLLKIFERHPCDLKLYDDVMKWISFHGRNTDIDWKTPVWLSRMEMINHLKKVLAASGMELIDKIVVTKKGGKVTVPCYDFKSMVLSLLYDWEVR